MRYLSIEDTGPLVDKLLSMSAQVSEAYEIAMWLSRLRAGLWFVFILNAAPYSSF